MRSASVLLAALLLCPVASVLAADGYPEFDWDRVPLYAHLGIGSGLEPEQYHFLADHFDIVAFTGGILRNAPVEPNIAAAAKAIKERNPKSKVIFLLGIGHAQAPVATVERDVPGRRLSPRKQRRARLTSV